MSSPQDEDDKPQRTEVPLAVPELLGKRAPWKIEEGGRAGLHNLGNTCFFNASIQALLHCPQVVHTFTSDELRNRGTLGAFSRDFADLADRMWSGHSRVLTPRQLLHDIIRTNNTFRGYGQQDAQELIRCLIDNLHEEMKYEQPEEQKRMDEDEVEDSPKKEDDSSSETAEKPPRKKRRIMYNSPMQQIFEGSLKSQVICGNCGHVSTTYEPFQELTVEIPDNNRMDTAANERKVPAPSRPNWFSSMTNWMGVTSQTIPLHWCIHSFCCSESLFDDNSYSCEHCKQKVTARKRMSISKLPEVLCIYIKRFKYGNVMGSGKLSQHVQFPVEEMLDMLPYLDQDHIDDPENEDRRFFLHGMVRHMGGTGGGHYVSYCRHPITGKWFCFDDQYVTEISPSKVANQQAYVLFYCRQEKPQHYSYVKRALANNPAERSVWISKEWLYKVALFNNPGPIDNNPVCCIHGTPMCQGHPSLKRNAIMVSESAANLLEEHYGIRGARLEDRSLPIQESWYCEGCQKERRAEGLRQRRQKEKDVIRDLVEERTSQHYCVNQAWVKRWKDWIMARTDDLPGPIDNAELVDEEGRPRRGLREGDDYTEVNTHVFKYLCEAYKLTGPTVPAPVSARDDDSEMEDVDDKEPRNPPARQGPDRGRQVPPDDPTN